MGTIRSKAEPLEKAALYWLIAPLTYLALMCWPQWFQQDATSRNYISVRSVSYQAEVSQKSFWIFLSVWINLQKLDHDYWKLEPYVLSVSGNGKCVKAGKLSAVASGPEDIFKQVEEIISR